jgi:glycosyltransferase involved in cell wall biosynthesis
MHIGVDATCWRNLRGYGRHARALLTELVRLDQKNRYTFVVDSPQNLETIPPEVNLKRVDAANPTVTAASSNGHRSVLDMWRMSRAMSAKNFDMLLFPTVYSYVPVFSPAKKLVIIHDVIPEKFPQFTLPTRSARLFWQLKSAAGRRQADAVVTVSDYSRQGLLEHFKLDPSQVHVVGEASDSVFRIVDGAEWPAAFTALDLFAADRAIVYVGGFGPHKNVDMLVKVFAGLAGQPEFAGVKLALVGATTTEVYHSYFSAISRQVDQAGLAGRVIFTGFVPDDQLVLLLNRAEVLVLPSLMEGYGLPAVEAAACGCPVIATTASPLPGLLGQAALYFNPTRPAELEHALTQVLCSEAQRAKMAAAGLEAVHKLTWEAAARQMLAVIEKVSAL